MRLTKKKAIEITKELWEYLVETGRESKHNWPGWKKYGEMAGECSCCEYAVRAWERHESDDFCELCPLYGQWNGQDSCISDDEDSPTPYDDWYDATTKAARKQAAQKIVDICDKALK